MTMMVHDCKKKENSITVTARAHNSLIFDPFESFEACSHASHNPPRRRHDDVNAAVFSANTLHGTD